MKNYVYETVKFRNKDILLIEVEYDGLEYQMISVYPIARVTHFRFIINRRIESISNYLHNAIVKGLSPSNGLARMFYVTETKYENSEIKHLHIQFQDCAFKIFEQSWIYELHNKSEGERFAILKGNPANPLYYKYIYEYDGKSYLYKFSYSNFLEVKYYNNMDNQRVYKRLHFSVYLKETVKRRMRMVI